MKASRTIGIRMTAVFVTLALAATPALAQAPATEASSGVVVEKVSQAKPTKAQTAARSARNMTGGPQEGIKVHGDWTIVVRNEDGSVASRHKFRNALQSSGRNLLVNILAGQSVAGRWRVELADSAGGICGGLCLLDQNGVDLNVTVPTSGPNAGLIVLTGSKKATLGGDILAVATALSFCPGSMSPGACSVGSLTGFTSKNLTAPIPVAANQTMDVTVVISFS